MYNRHTPTPWDINGFNLTSIIKVKPGPDSKGNTYVDGRHSVKVANVMGEDDMTWGERHANAEFIVRACNAHDDLVKALEKLMSLSTGYGEVSDLINILCKEALSKAKGGA